jgi:hypothetical protein
MQDHQRSLLLDRRCAWCAEPARLGVLLRGEACEHCGRTSPTAEAGELDGVLEAVQSKWKAKRAWAYGGLAVGTLVTGWFPIASSVLMVGVLIYLRVALLRQPMNWFGPTRRFTARFALQLWLLVVGVGAFAVAELSTFIPFASAPLKAAISVASIGLFTEVAVAYLGSRLRREASADSSLQWHEWALPAALLTALVGLGAAAAAVVISLVNLVS